MYSVSVSRFSHLTFPVFLKARAGSHSRYHLSFLSHRPVYLYFFFLFIWVSVGHSLPVYYHPQLSPTTTYTLPVRAIFSFLFGSSLLIPQFTPYATPIKQRSAGIALASRDPATSYRL
ncbi:hypothetical protein B0H11DRAFT_236965 [Mycena galericulata]|nr:hypothetical protein B0H11DRAFT_236965 [Mycena galericulata]